MSNLVSYRFEDGVATIAMDDGKVNVLSLRMLAELNAALDRAQQDRRGCSAHRPTGRALGGIRSAGAERLVAATPPTC